MLSFSVPYHWKGSQSLLRQRLLPGPSNARLALGLRYRLNRFFVSDYFRADEPRVVRTPAEMSLNRFFVSDYFRASMKSTPLKHKRRRLNRFFVSDYFRASSVSSVQMRSMLQVSIASSSAITSGLLSFGRDRFISFEVSIASSSAITSGHGAVRTVSLSWRTSQSLLRQRLLPGSFTAGAAAVYAKGLNRFFVSDYFRARTRASRRS